MSKEVKITVRFPSQKDYEAVVRAARKADISINKFVTREVTKAARRDEQESETAA